VSIVLDPLQVSLILKLSQARIPLNTCFTSKSTSHRTTLSRLNRISILCCSIQFLQNLLHHQFMSLQQSSFVPHLHRSQNLLYCYLSKLHVSSLFFRSTSIRILSTQCETLHRFRSFSIPAS